MKLSKKIIAVILSVIMLSQTLFVFSEEEYIVSFEIGVDVPENSYANLGDVVTVTVATTQNCGIAGGTLFFKSSSNLEYVSSTLLGESSDAIVAIDGENKGAFGVIILDDGENAFGEVTDNFSSFAFRVVGTGNASVEVYLYDGLTSDFKKITSDKKSISFNVKNPEPAVIKTKTLPNAYLNKQYSYQLETENSDYSEWTEWEVTDGELPSGISLLNDGTISGTPEEFGFFEISIKAVILDEIDSEEQSLTLTVKEKETKLVLNDSSNLSIDNENKFIKNISAETSVSSLLSEFTDGENIKVFDQNGDELDSDSLVGTGCEIKLMDGDIVLDSCTAIIIGDVNGDGEIATIDYQRIRAYYLGKLELSGAELAAAHVAGNEDVSTIDFQRVRAHYLGKYNLYA